MSQGDTQKQPEEKPKVKKIVVPARRRRYVTCGLRHGCHIFDMVQCSDFTKSMQKVRDECIALHGPDSEECQKLIENHKACLRAEGFKVCIYAW